MIFYYYKRLHLVFYVLFILISIICSISEISEPYNYWKLPNYTPPEGTPKLGLTYLHMRKAGGSAFLAFMRNWMTRSVFSPTNSELY